MSSLHPSAYKAHRLRAPEDLVPLALGAKHGMIYGLPPDVRPDKYCDHRDDYNHGWEAELGHYAVAIASRYGVRLRKWLEHEDHAVWLDGPIRDEDADLLIEAELFGRKRFTTEVAYALTLDWYAPHGWLPPLVRLAAMADG